MQPLKNVLPPSDGVPYVFYNFETTQNTLYSDRAKVHVPNLVCTKQFSSLCESADDVERDGVQCGRRKHSFSDDPVGDVTLSLRIASRGQADNCYWP